MDASEATLGIASELLFTSQREGSQLGREVMQASYIYSARKEYSFLSAKLSFPKNIGDKHLAIMFMHMTEQYVTIFPWSAS